MWVRVRLKEYSLPVFPKAKPALERLLSCTRHVPYSCRGLVDALNSCRVCYPPWAERLICALYFADIVDKTDCMGGFKMTRRTTTEIARTRSSVGQQTLDVLGT